MNSIYTYNTSWRKTYLKMEEDLRQYEQEPCVQIVEDGIILPSIKDSKLFWGKGGVVDSDGDIVESSIVKGAFGGRYEYLDSELESIDEAIIYLGVLPLHWGHFLIDFLCRLWILSEKYNYKLAYIPRFFDGAVEGTYRECLELLGIDVHQLIRIEQPIRVNKIIIPENSMGFGTMFSTNKYKSVINIIKNRALEKASNLNITPYDKVYFTRRNFTSRDIGEKEIERNFELNGFKVLAPERLSLVEQIFYINSAKTVASIGGTITHNFMFANNSTELLFLNRHPKPNPPQFRINYIFDLNIIWIDVYNKWQLIYSRHYGDPHIGVEVSAELKRYFRNHNMLYKSYYFQRFIKNPFDYYNKWFFVPAYWDFRAKLGKLKKSIINLIH